MQIVVTNSPAIVAELSARVDELIPRAPGVTHRTAFVEIGGAFFVLETSPARSVVHVILGASFREASAYAAGVDGAPGSDPGATVHIMPSQCPVNN